MIWGDNTLKRQLIIGHGNTFHDPAIAIIEGDKVFAEAIERHTQCKKAVEVHRLWYSWRAVKSALSHLGLWPVGDADVLSVSSWEYSRLKEAMEKKAGKRFWEKNPGQFPLGAVMMNCLPAEPLFVNHLAWIFQGYPPRIESFPAEPSPGVIRQHDISWTSKEIGHHLSHAANAVYTSPFEECVVIVIDGYGETTSMALYHFEDNTFRPLHTFECNSLGFFYAFITELCGFNSWEGEEWKIMGLAAYGKPNDDIYNFFKNKTSVDGLNFRMNFDAADITNELEPLVGGFRSPGDPDFMRSADLSYNFQKWFEDTLITIIQAASDLGLSKNLAYAGGCALNSSANGKILRSTGFERLHIPSSPADDGNALGAALYEKYCVRGQKRDTREIMSPYLGTMIDIPKLEKILGFGGIQFKKAADETELCREAAELLAEGNIIGWVQGRAEFGPRALGNRSILTDPRPADMKDKINERVKFREVYRPLAPSILHEFGDAYFEDYQESPYMERTLVFRKEVRDNVPAVVHKNGTGRLQTVKAEWNPLYYRLIRAFYEKTGVPLVLNTSFNVMGKPIMHSVEDAITVLYTTGLDYLIIGNYILYK
jgi:carbamoyltransferase